MTEKKTNEEGKVQNATLTDLNALKKIEKAFYRNNEASQRRNTKKSIEWFRKYIPKNWNHVKTSQMFRDRSLWSQKPSPGYMYFFDYSNPVHKDTLPIYDAYPLIFPWDIWRGDGSWGEDGKLYMIAINLHYLPPKLRQKVMVELLKIKTEKRFRKNTRLKLSWQVLQGLSNSRLYEHAVHMYRLDHVRSKFVQIPSASWEMAVFLPLARFKKGSKSQAWKI